MKTITINSVDDLNNFLKKIVTTGPLTVQQSEKEKTDKEEIIGYLLQIRKIRTDSRDAYDRRLFALNPMVKDYEQRAGKMRSDVIRMQRKINLVDDIINWINEK